MLARWILTDTAKSNAQWTGRAFVAELVDAGLEDPARTMAVFVIISTGSMMSAAASRDGMVCQSTGASWRLQHPMT